MRNFYITIGVWLLIIPMLGISGIWKNRLVALTGLIVTSEALWPIIIKKIAVKPRIRKKIKNKEEVLVGEKVVNKAEIEKEEAVTAVTDNFVENGAPEKEGN